MKKILIIQVIIALITVYEVRLINKISSSISELTRLTNVDSVINRVRIDSIELVITQKDSTIVNIKNTIEHEVKEANSLNDSASLELFERLVSN
ncbi:hypothetical protein [uncultured phage cr91_1]|uniref:Uncharacterized protein n=1 Tax=uncultured phage cr91_1 TaxID=2986403 RepID=A0AAE7RVV5_9CAUD|nr:hypothetical protein M1M48_gp80 [uncultured phage cr91_1]QWM89640.1 hypothetical protein [uncultured phage cr91_1]